MTSPDVNIIFAEEPININLGEEPVEIEMPAGRDGQSIRPRGAWSSSEDYGYLDLVSYQGSSYVATKTVPTGTLPTDTHRACHFSRVYRLPSRRKIPSLIISRRIVQ